MLWITWKLPDFFVPHTWRLLKCDGLSQLEKNLLSVMRGVLVLLVYEGGTVFSDSVLATWQEQDLFGKTHRKVENRDIQDNWHQLLLTSCRSFAKTGRKKAKVKKNSCSFFLIHRFWGNSQIFQEFSKCLKSLKVYDYFLVSQSKRLPEMHKL